MCDIANISLNLESNAKSPCVNSPRYLCSNLERCPHAQQLFSSKIARLCDGHVSFCRWCGRPFCPECQTAHQAACACRPINGVEVVSLRDMVENAMGKMGL